MSDNDDSVASSLVEFASVTAPTASDTAAIVPKDMEMRRFKLNPIMLAFVSV